MKRYRVNYVGGVLGVVAVTLCGLMVIFIPLAVLLIPTLYEITEV